MMVLYVGIALLASHVLGELLRGWETEHTGRTMGAGLAVAVTGYVAAGAWVLWPVPLAAVIVFVAVRLAHRFFPQKAWAWVTVQAGTLLLIAALAALVFPALAEGGLLLGTAWPDAVFVVLTVGMGLAATVGLGGAFMNLAIGPFAIAMRGPGVIQKGGRVIEPLENGFENGGQVIGYYERLLIFLFVLADAPTAIGFLVAAKSVLRFGDLKDGQSRKNAEYIIIGTLMSFAYALVVAYGTRLLLALLATL